MLGVTIIKHTVKSEESGVRVNYLSLNRMGSAQLILSVGPSLHRRIKVLPRESSEIGGITSAKSRHVRGKALVEPQAIPPDRRDQITEPHVSPGK